MATQSDTIRKKQLEGELTELTKKVTSFGYEVRRMKLSRGPGWKAVSGACRVSEQKVIFVDTNQPLEEQIAFLATISERHTPSTATPSSTA